MIIFELLGDLYSVFRSDREFFHVVSESLKRVKGYIENNDLDALKEWLNNLEILVSFSKERADELFRRLNQKDLQ